jgi:hypothetical protein
LETDSLTVELTPLKPIGNFVICNLVIGKPTQSFAGFQLPNYPITKLQNLLHFLVRRVLAAPVAKLLQFQPIRRRFAVLRGRVIPLFALTTLQRNDLSGHRSLQTSFVWRGHSFPRAFVDAACSADRNVRATQSY